MLVSVIIPTYNRPSLLTEAIGSCIAQTYRPIECIVVDDGSTDDIKAVVEGCMIHTGDAFTLTYIRQDNAGAQVARNTGTRMAKGDFIQYLDSDDLLYPAKLSQQVDFFEKYQNCDAVFGDWEVGTADKKETIHSFKSDDLISQLLTGSCIANFAILMRSSLIKKIGDWDITIKRNQEVDFHLRGLLVGGKFEHQPLCCGLWRMHDGERIANSSGLKHTIFFFTKWESILMQYSLLTSSLKKQLGSLYKWLIFNNSNAEPKDLVKLFGLLKKNAPELRVFNGGRLQVISKIIGEKAAFRFWLIFKGRRTEANGQ